VTDQPATPSPTSGYEGWAVVELMGHRRRAGLVKEAEIFGTKMLRIDIPALPAPDTELAKLPLAEQPMTTEFYAGQAIYSLRPCTEAIARAAIDQIGDRRPPAPLDYRPREETDGPKALAHGPRFGDDNAHDFEAY
jgi:hypothetical protein